MKNITNASILLIFSALLFIGCKKEEIKAIYLGGEQPVLTSSAQQVHMTADDSVKTVITFKWSDPAYNFSTGKSTLDVVHTLEIDSAGRNFSSPQSLNLENVLQETSTKMLVKSFTGEEFNDLLLDLGLETETAYQIEARVSSSFYWQESKLVSEVITIDVTPYSSKPKPVYPVPANLFIVGDATAGGWNNPVPTPSQQFRQLDENTFSIIVQLSGGKEYLLLPENGVWGKFASDDNTSEERKEGGPFRPEAPHNFKAPDESGLYRITVDFLTGMYSVEPATVPENLFIVGSATAGDWTNEVPVPSQQFTKTSVSTFELIIPLKASMEYLLIPVNGQWGKFASDDNTSEEGRMGGKFRAEAPHNFRSPTEAGTYKIEVDFTTETYKLTKQ